MARAADRISFPDPRRDRHPRLHVAIGPVCNNNCLFCMEEDRRRRRETNGALRPEHIRTILETGRGAEEVCFTSGEPTLVAELPRYATWARELGYPRVSVATNGRRLAYAAYCERLLAAGVNRLHISVHGHTAKLHDGLTRCPGSFAQTCAGLSNAVRLGRPSASVHTSTVVTKRNLPYLDAICAFLRAQGVEQVVLNALQASGRANTHFERVCPSYSEIAARFVQVLAALPERRPPVFLVDVPLCTTEQVPDFNRGWVETYVHHEVSTATGGECPDDGRLREVGESDLVERRRSDLDDARRSKRLACQHCRYDSVCEGVWTNYLRRHGWNEFEPVPKG